MQHFIYAVRFSSVKVDENGNTTIRKSNPQKPGKMQMSLIRQNDKEYYLRSKTEEETKQIIKALDIREVPDLIPGAMIN